MLPTPPLFWSYVTQIGYFLFFSIVLHLPMILLNELIALSLSKILPVYEIPDFHVPSFHFTIIMALHVFVFVEMLLHHKYYRAEFSKHSTISLSFGQFVWDSLYGFFFGTSVSLSLFLVISFLHDARTSFRYAGVENNLTVAIVMLILKPFWCHWGYIGSHQYVIHKTFHAKSLYYTFHGEHHMALSQSALVGVDAGFWEMMVRVPGLLCIWPTVGKGLLLWALTTFNIWNFFAHHYYNEAPFYRKCLQVSSKFYGHFFHSEYLVDRSFADYFTWDVIKQKPGSDNALYDWRETPFYEDTLHGLHHWRSFPVYGFGLVDAVDFLDKNRCQKSHPE